MRDDLKDVLTVIGQRLDRLEQQAELIKTVLIVKEPGAVMAADAYEGLRKQVAFGSSERRAHLGQLTSMAVAVSRATSVEDLRVQVQEWMNQAGVGETWTVPEGRNPAEFFEVLDVGPASAAGSLRILEPAYVDAQTGLILRTGRAQYEPGQTSVSVWAAGPKGASE